LSFSGTISYEKDGLVVDPKFLSHPFDMRVAIKKIGAILRISLSSKWKGDITATLWGPEIKWSPNLDIDGIPDEAMSAFVKKKKKVVNHSYHEMSILVMGEGNDRRGL